MAEAVKDPDIFLGRKANSYSDFKKSDSNQNADDINRIGFKVIPKLVY